MTEALDYEKKIKNQLEVIKRIDTYIGTTNTKCTIIMSYCAAATAFIFTFLSKLEPSHASLPLLVEIGLFSTLALFFGLWCMTLAALVIFPVTFSTPKNHKGESLIFYGDIASATDGGSYSEKVKQVSEEDFLEDLNGQIYTLASIASDKFSRIKFATIILMIHFGCMTGVLIGAILLYLS